MTAVSGSLERRINPNLITIAGWHKEGLPDPENPHLGGKAGGILEGSSRSGKTISSVDFIIRLCSKAKRPLTINVFKKTYNSFKTTLYIDFSKRLQDFGLDDPFAGKKEVSSFFILGSKITFIGADSSDETILGAGCDYAYFNEMLDIPQHIFDQVEMRCSRFWWGDYNPKTTVHWVYDKIQRRKDVGFLRTTFKDNPWIPAAQKRKILSYCPYHPDDEHLPEKQRRPHPVNVEAGTADDYMWNVYGLGLRSAPEGLIFQHVTWIEKFPENIENIYYGSDIGYTQSPSTLVKMGINGDNMYLELLHYGPTPSSNEYIPIIRQHNPGGITWADSAEPGYIIDCGQAGLSVIGVKKFPGSIKYGISIMKRYKIHIVNNDDWKNEQANYKYREINGVRFDEPVDDFNHCFTAGTLVTTDHGDLPIESIQPGDMVLTSEGYQPVIEMFNNGTEQVKDYSLQFDTQSLSLSCTPDHKIKTDKGWVEISKLQSGMMVYLVNHLTVRFTDSILENDTSHAAAKKCIGQSGNSDMASGQKDTISTTRTETLGITSALTLSLETAANICPITLNRDSKTIPTRSKDSTLQELRLQNSGMQALMGSNGIASTAKNHGRTDDMSTAHVNSAEAHLRPVTQDRQSIVEITAKLVRIEQSNERSETVYDLAVLNCHEYYANGLLVSNCWDAARYAALSNLMF